MYQQDAKQILENTTQLVGIFENLVPDTFYQVKCILSVAQLEISSDWKTVETNCIRKSDLSFLIHVVVHLPYLKCA